MDYLARFRERYQRFREAFPQLRSLIVVAARYTGEVAPFSNASPRGRVARYAAGQDYHHAVLRRLHQLGEELQAFATWPVHYRCCVDTAPLHERSLAKAAGIGFIGKNTCLIIPKGGSWVVLGVIATDLILEPDAPSTQSCGACRRCLDACPTNALVKPYEMDARRCISYLTLEHRGSIPEELRAQIGPWLIGCDICQEVCPYNAAPGAASWPELTPAAGTGQGIPLKEALGIHDPETFRTAFSGTALTRPKYQGFVRNAAIAAGNASDPELLPLLRQRLQDEDPVIRDATSWAASKMT